MKYTITVTEEDIRNGERRNCGKCPVALAATRAIGHYTEIVSDCGWVNFEEEGLPLYGTEFKMPKEAETFIKAFDADSDDVAPFSFEIDLEIPEEARKA